MASNLEETVIEAIETSGPHETMGDALGRVARERRAENDVERARTALAMLVGADQDAPLIELVARVVVQTESLAVAAIGLEETLKRERAERSSDGRNLLDTIDAHRARISELERELDAMGA